MFILDEELYHYGTPRHSGRYPWGSGEKPQRSMDFLGQVSELRKATDSKGNKIYSNDTEVAKAMGMSSNEFRARVSSANAERRASIVAQALKYEDEGMNRTEAARRLGVSESTLRSMLDPIRQERAKISENVTNKLKDSVDEHKYIDVGVGTETRLGISNTKLKACVDKLEEEGYHTIQYQYEQLGTGNKTTMKVLVGPDTTWQDVRQNYDKIRLVDGYSEDNSRTILNIEKPVSVDSKRVQICYAEQGGTDKDGVIELRRGVEDLSLGNAHYAQVRIAVDDTHYLKGMAMYADDLPKGVDIRFNTNKHEGTPMLGEKDHSVLKPMKKDIDNPFGATIKNEEDLIMCQRHYIDKNGKRQLSPINVVNEEGDWERWSKSLSSQVLSKQPIPLARKQLDIKAKQQDLEFEEIKKLTNPVVRQKLLDSFADDCDSKAVHLKAAALPRQSSHAILPLPDIKTNEVYATNYRNGEHVVLIRYPHQGKFEIPELVVNNNNAKAKSLLGNPKDAIGIHPSVAQRLSGADFDGDSVLVIPVNSKVKISTQRQLTGLENFDPKESYPGYEGMKRMTKQQKGIEMGKVSNLITDMTLRDAPEEDMVKATKHAQVVIDAEKHGLNWKQSEVDNQILALKKKYQGGENAGASTLISRASAEIYIPDRRLKPKSRMTESELRDYENGKQIWENTGKQRVDKNGNMVDKLNTTTRMAVTNDAYELSSGTVIESVYADYANHMKHLANEARKESRATKLPEVSPTAKEAYKEERASLDAKLNIVYKNKPLERQAQLMANKAYRDKLRDNPDMDNDEKKRTKNQALAGARLRVGKKSYDIEITDREWEAMQAGAIPSSKMRTILDNTDMDKVRQRATPRTTVSMSPQKVALAKSMLKNHTMAEVADALNVSTSTLSKQISK